MNSSRASSACHAMVSPRCFVCLYSVPTPSGDTSELASVTKNISERSIERSPVLQQALASGEADEDEPKLMLPLGASADFLDAWLHFAEIMKTSSENCKQIPGATIEFVVKTLQVRATD